METSTVELPPIIATKNNTFLINKEDRWRNVRVDGNTNGNMEVHRTKFEEHEVRDRAMEQKASIEKEREKDRIFWETCLASGYP